MQPGPQLSLAVKGGIASQIDWTLTIIAAFIPTFLCLAPVQHYINAVNEKLNPGHRYYGWSSGHMVCIGVGILDWIAVIRQWVNG